MQYSATRQSVFHGRRPGGRRGPLAAAVVALCLTLVVGSCTSGSKTAELPDGEKPGRQVTVGKKNAWTESDLGMARVEAVTFREDAALMYARSGGRLAVAEAKTGEPRWARGPGEPLERSTSDSTDAMVLSADYGGWLGHDGELLTVGRGRDWAVIAPYEVKNGGPRGVVALSGRDGSVLWQRELARKGEKGKVRLLDADERRVLVALYAKYDDGLRSFGLDAAKGERLWQAKDEWVYELAGDTALGLREPAPGWEPHHESSSGQGRLFGVDATSGTERWAHRDGRYGNPTIRAAVPGRAALNVEVEAGSKRSGSEHIVGVVIDTGTGREVHRDKSGFYPCAADTGLLACTTSDDELVTVRAGRNTKPATAERSPAKELGPVAVHQDRIYLSGERRDGDREQHRYAAVDRAGNPVLEEADGTLLAASEAQVALQTSPDAGRSTSRAKKAANSVVVRPVAVGD